MRAAALIPIREAFQYERAQRKGGAKGAAVESVAARPISTADLFAALEVARPTGEAARNYRQFQSTSSRTSFNVQQAPVAAAPHRPKGSSPGTGGSDAETVAPIKPVTPVCSFGPSARANSVKMTAALEDSMRVAAARTSAAISAVLVVPGSEQ